MKPPTTLRLHPGRRIAFLFLAAALTCGAHAQDPFQRATESAALTGHALGKVHRWLHEIALKQIDPDTGLYRADRHWNYRDTAADCYPFLAWAAHVVDQDVLNGPVRTILHREIALCNTVERIPVPWDFPTAAPQKDIAWDEMVFQASEYIKDGLIAIVEITGRDEWFDRMRAITDDLWKTARVDTPFGKITTTNFEINGDHLQALPRLYAMTGDEKYLDWADRIADYYFADENFEVTRLRDHGCEVIGGLGLLLAIETAARPDRAARYAPRLKKVYDDILARGCNEDGLMYDELGKKEGRLSDGWGYNYVGYLCYDLATHTDTYRPKVAATLANIMKPAYKDYPWEGESIDGYADAIEGALYLLNRVPAAEGLTWVDRETRNNLVDHPTRLENGELWGTMKLQSNAVRTTLMHALMHTRGVIARPFLQGLELGAAPDGDGLVIALRAPGEYTGLLEFDLPRHRMHIGFEQDWPRMNTLPEWFTVDPEARYTVQRGDEPPRVYTGWQLHTGLEVTTKPGAFLKVSIAPVRQAE